MKNVSCFIATVFLLVAGLTVSAGCSDPSTDDRDQQQADAAFGCSPSNCAGCCDENGICQPGLNDKVCGAGGAACSNCAASDELCVEGSCAIPGCGNGVIEEGEECEGDDLQGETCTSLGFDSGTLACSADCTYETSACELDECRVDQQGPQNCSFCSTVLDDAIIECGYCQNCTGDDCPPDEVERCASDEKCVTLTTLDQPGCVAEDSQPCDPDTFQPSCDGDTKITCPSGWIVRKPCDPEGYCMIGGRDKPVCVESGLGACDSDTYERRCDGDSYIGCSWNDVEVRQECDTGETCVQGDRSVDCAPAESESCDPDTYQRACSGTRGRTYCDPRGIVRVDEDRCPVGQKCVEDPTGTPHCTFADASECDPAAYQSTCDGSAAIGCPQWLGYEWRTECAAPNPECRVVGQYAGCTFPGSEACDTSFSECRAGSSEYVYDCNTTLGVEMRIACLTNADGEDCSCGEDEVWGVGCVDPQGEANCATTTGY